ncbi:hypothetical protein BDQ12DRAFT_765588 [Crucibulum laeve]|uniref:DUF6534 domain-containing protein n=1 Tax=Crucibulum laeve TaxID=68775 RepID=A0A5C3LNT2_9AGAR|nr:hypothetical protein BDQ12DRAFT_765588 [Crucibulum laeve]
MSSPNTASALLPLHVSSCLNIIGYLLNWGLFGVNSVQVSPSYTVADLYYLAFPNDKTLTKSVVYSVYCLEVFQSIVIARDSFVTFASGFGDPGAVTVACIVQLFYAFRIRVLSTSKVLPLIIVTLALTQCGAGISAAVIIHNMVDLTKRANTTLFIAQGLRLGATAVCDITIALSMLFLLTRGGDTKDGERLKSTEAMVVRILKLSIATGTLTALFAVLDLSLYFGLQKSGGYFLIPCISLGKLYSNSMMVMLNNRIQIIGGRNTIDTSIIDVDLSSGILGNSINAQLKTWSNGESSMVANSRIYQGESEEEVRPEVMTK